MISGLDKSFMTQAVDLALRAQGRTAPNPIVGAVIVREGQVVGKGFHKKAGGPHAEIFALRDAGDLARGATLYVTLEPCNHTGKTPPCSHAVLDAGIKRVVIGTLDPNPVAQGGAEFLRQKGVTVDVGCCEADCQYIIAPFVKHVKTGRPWVRSKVAMSLDGRIATRTGDSQWITGEQARGYGHRLRDSVNAILVGKNTVLADNPSLTTRLPGGNGHDPVRIVLASDLHVPDSCNLVRQSSSACTIVVGAEERADMSKKAILEKAGCRVKIVKQDRGHVDLDDLLSFLGSIGIQDLLVEGGARVHGSFWDRGLVDEAFFFIAPMVIGGESAPCAIGGIGPASLSEAYRSRFKLVEPLGDDLLLSILKTDPSCFWIGGEKR